MLDIKLLRKNTSLCEALLKRKDPNITLSPIITLDKDIRSCKTLIESWISEKKKLSQELYLNKKIPTSQQQELEKKIVKLSEKIEEKNLLLKNLSSNLQELMSQLPNFPEEDVPISLNKSDNVVIKTFGSKPNFNFLPKNHLELNQIHHLFDFVATAKTTGSGWPIYTGIGAQLEWALLSFMIEKQIQHGFNFCLPPVLVKKEILYGSGQIPKFNGQFYEVLDNPENLYLIPTAEVILNGLHHNQILYEKDFPFQYAAFSPCFRKEAGAAGAQERGLVRMHQFHKIEMFAFTTTSEQEELMFSKMLLVAQDILTSLELHHQLSLLTTGDMSFSATKTIDIEVWLPGQNRYYEVSSISKCSDFQSRRSNIRYRDEKTKEIHYVKTLNGSGLATPRLMVALIENNQQEDGTITIPKVLQKYFPHSKLTVK